jgi:phospholipase C
VQARLIEPAGDPHSYTVGAGDRLRVSVPVTGNYDVHLHGPNGWFRRFAGTEGQDGAVISLTRTGSTLELRLSVDAPRGTKVVVTDGYAGRLTVRGRRAVLDTTASAGWYDLTVTVPGTSYVRTFAGHLENGKPSLSDPALGQG